MLNPKYQVDEFVRFTGLRRNERRFKYQFSEDFENQQLQETAKIISIFYNDDRDIFEYEVVYPFQSDHFNYNEKTILIKENQLEKINNQDFYKEIDDSFDELRQHLKVTLQ
tara:strand:- start:81 stop:413 length:333 start_codon:yes stop_codon:yes gene_type:complete